MNKAGNYVFLEFENGAAGTSVLVTEKYLYIYSLDQNGLLQLKKEQLEERQLVDNRTHMITDRQYQIKSLPHESKPVVEVKSIEPAGTTVTISY